MRQLLALLALLPLAATAADCRYSASRNLHEDLAGIRGVQVELHSHDMHLMGDGNANALELTGRACASSQSALDTLQVTSHREGDQLIVDVDGHGLSASLFGISYAYLDVQLKLPANMPVSVNTGSGDAYVSGLAQLNAQTGSGDLHVDRISGEVYATAGSGDVEISDVGSLRVGSVGSGDLKARSVHKDVQIGSVGSGDVTLENVGGSVTVDTIGSGDLVVREVRGNLTVRAKGSGDVTQSGIGGKVSVPHDDD
ncbi:DUF4097 family beta strand repeat-containing protein [Dyella flagellata]|uniref:DUF4097 domain-containing protein n=1 Tax=Dyella flagellata TaxID=1867833 RepID=A0ABQ5XGU0_9GAMM|nr:DUF4097 family beta strand repeat-containing protein [Dyella flagellata]GLQ89715.1 hypothetical protein GCM10007898_32900 [Dyella flagellata]